MIGYLEGRIIKKEEDRILLLVNHVGYEILLPANVMGTIGTDSSDDLVSLYIYYYQTERQPKPTLIGFNLEAEKEFFQYFISVEAIGPMKAVKAMTIPARDIARAIEDKDDKKLTTLSGIGKRTAQKIIATLEGKMGKFVLINSGDGDIEADEPESDFIETVRTVLVSQLGYKPVDAGRMISEAIDRNKGISTPEDLFDEVYQGQMK